MSDADDFESVGAVTDLDANGPPNTHGLAAPPVAEGLLTARRVEALLGRTRRTLRNWERRGWLRPVRIGRSIFYRPRDIEALAECGAPRLPAAPTSAPNQSVPALSGERA
jgi:hypothetical protein